MPIDPDYPNDVFVSYAREDAEWAKRLAAALTARGLVVFRDEERLTAGERWDLQLVSALRLSRQLVVLHSDVAATSDWVRKEVEQFLAIRHHSRIPSGVGDPIAVILDGRWKPFDPYEVVSAIKDRGAYAAGAAALDEGVWLDVTDKVEAGIRVRDARRPIAVVLLTTTRARLEQVDADKQHGAGLSLNVLAQQLGMGTCDAVLDRYGERRIDWRPFGEDGIRVLLQEIQDDINDRLGSQTPGVRWVYPDEAALWDGTAEDARRTLRRLEREPCLIVLDPLAFFDDQVKRWFDNVLGKPMLNPEGLVLVLAPVPPVTALLLRKQLEEVAFKAFESFYEPSLQPGARYARAALHVADRLDLQGWLLSTLRPMLTGAAERDTSLWTQVGKPSS